MNKDLADVFGNLVNRCLRFAASRFEGRVPGGGEPGAREAALAAELDRRLDALRRHHEDLEFRKAAAETRAVWAAANAYLADAAPWTAIRSDPDAAALATRTGLALLRLCATIAWPIIPDTAATVLRALGDCAVIPPWPDRPAAELLAALSPGNPVSTPGILVRKITESEVPALEERFGAAASAVTPGADA